MRLTNSLVVIETVKKVFSVLCFHVGPALLDLFNGLLAYLLNAL